MRHDHAIGDRHHERDCRGASCSVGTPTRRSPSSTPRTTRPRPAASLLVRHSGEAEEIVQDSFVAMHGKWRRLREPEKALGYLRRSVVNPARSAQRHHVVVDRHLRARGAPPRARPPRAPRSTPSARDASRRDGRAARTCPQRQREVLVLRYYSDLAEIDIAAALGISRGAVKSHASRGLTHPPHHARGHLMNDPRPTTIAPPSCSRAPLPTRPTRSRPTRGRCRGSSDARSDAVQLRERWVLGALGGGARHRRRHHGGRPRRPERARQGHHAPDHRPANPTTVEQWERHQGTYDPAADSSEQFTMYYVGPRLGILRARAQPTRRWPRSLYTEPHTVTDATDDVDRRGHEFLTSTPIDPDYSSGWPDDVDIQSLTTDGSNTDDRSGRKRGPRRLPTVSSQARRRRPFRGSCARPASRRRRPSPTTATR